MDIWGENILFDASLHLTSTIFILYAVWLFIEGFEKFRKVYLILALLVVVVMSIQRIVAGEHNVFGLLLALVISLFGIVVSRRDYLERFLR